MSHRPRFMTPRRIRVASLMALVTLGLACSDDLGGGHSSGATPHWEYEGEHGPERWGELTPEFAACAQGVAQSPVDLGAARPADLPDLVMDYRPGTVSVADNGHTVQATAVSPDSSITVDGTRFTLLQMHFHAPSEHTIDGEFAPAEVHFVHRSEAGDLAVIGVMLTEGQADNAAWNPYTQALVVGEGTAVEATLDWPAMLPTDALAIRYAGSLTTPPCTEGVRWIVMETPVALSVAQLDDFIAAHEGNHRPVQPLNDREVLADTSRG